MEVTVGIKARVEITVTDAKTAAAMGSGLQPVFATPCMIALMEEASAKAVMDCSGENTVGTYVEVSHVSATPVGMKVWAEGMVTAVDGRMIDFEVKAYDEKGLIGEGKHRRAVINPEKFMQRTLAKLDA